MNASRYLWLAIATLVLFLLASWKNNRGVKSIRAVMSAYRAGDYAAGLQATERLKDGTTATGEYCVFRGYMLHQLGRFHEAEDSFRQALPLRSDPRLRALSLNSLATVLMDQERFTEAIAFYENASQVWPDRGASFRGMAEVWLRQGREPTEALGCAQHAVAIDRNATGMSKEILSHRLGEDLAVLAWAHAVNSKSATEVEAAVAEAFHLCDNRSVPILAEVHYHAGRAYLSLENRDKSNEHFRQAAEIDPHGRFGRLAASTFS